jgi:acetyl esterase/lipase
MQINALACLFLLGSAISSAAEMPEIILWPKGTPEPVVPADPPEQSTRGADDIVRRTNVSQPRLIVHVPPTGVAKQTSGVIVIPGGGFTKLADEHEGSDACVWLAKQGLTTFQLVHRTPTNKHAEPFAGPVQDAQQALLTVRSRAKEFGLDPAKIGVLGFSAGGQVAVIAATNAPKFPASTELSHKPDFLLLLYPYQIYNPATKALRAEIHPENGLPPTFIAQMGDDAGSLAQGSALLYLELINRKIPAELHIYERGGHGFGMRSRPGATGPTDWTHRAADWLRLRGLVQ